MTCPRFRIRSILRAASLLLAALLSFGAPAAAVADGGVRTVVLKGQQASGLDNGVIFSTFRISTLGGITALNDLGRVAFPAGLTGPGITSLNGGGLWLETSQGLALLAQNDMVSPGAGSEIRFSGLASAQRFTSAGQVGVFAIIKGPGLAFGNRHGLFVSGADGANLAAMARGTDPAPGIGGDAVLLEADNVQLNEAGQAAFGSNYSSTAGPGSGVWRFDSAVGHQLVVKSGDAAPGTASALFSGAYGATLNRSGQILFQGALVGGDATSLNDSGLWLNDPNGDTTIMLREGLQAPGAVAGVSFSSFSGTEFNDAGRVAFQAFLRGPGVNAGNNFGVWSSGGTGSLELLARQGSPAPGTSAGVVFGPGAAGGAVYPNPTLNNAGHVAFFCELTGSGVNSTNNVGLWSTAGGAGLKLVMREGASAPDTPAGVRFSFRPQDEGGTFFKLLDDGRIAFGSRLAGSGVTAANDQGIWAQDPNGLLKLVARTGQMLDVDDGPGFDLRTISSLDSGFSYIHGFNQRGQLLFQASFTDGSEGLFVSNLVAVPEPQGVASALVTLVLGLLMARRQSSHN